MKKYFEVNYRSAKLDYTLVRGEIFSEVQVETDSETDFPNQIK
jgi:hypothetical protein